MRQMRRSRGWRGLEVSDFKLFIAVSARRRVVTQTHRGLLCVARRKEIEDRQDGKCGRDCSCENREFHSIFDLLLLLFYLGLKRQNSNKNGVFCKYKLSFCRLKR